MIDLENETLVRIGSLPDELPKHRTGRKIHIATCYRWVTHGIRGICLESVMVGGGRCTSKEALSRFFNRLSVADRNDSSQGLPLRPSNPTAPMPRRSPSRRQRDSDRAAAELEAVGA